MSHLKKLSLFRCAYTVVGTLLLISWLWPFHFLPWTSFVQDFCAFIALLLTALCNRNFKLGPMAGFIFFVATIPVAQFFAGLIFFWGDALLASSYILALALAIVVGSAACETEAKRSEFYSFIAICIITASTISCAIAIRQWLHVAESDFEINLAGGRVYANLGQPNNLATLLLMGCAGLLYFYEKRKAHSALLTLVAIFLLLGVVLTQSRTPWVTFLFLGLFCAYMIRKKNIRFRLWLAIIWFFYFCAMTVAMPLVSDALGFGTYSLVERSASGRLELWYQLLMALKEYWLFGVGWNQVSVAQAAVSSLQPLPMMAEYSHNIILDLLLWNGVPLGGLIVLICSVWGWRLIRHVNDAETFFAVLVGLAIGVHSLFEFPFAYAYFLIPLGLLLGGARPPVRMVLNVPTWLMAAFLILGVVVLARVVFEYRVLQQEEFSRKVSDAGVVGFEQQYDSRGIVLLTQLSALMDYRRMTPHREESEESLADMRRVVWRYPYLANLYRYALILHLNGRRSESQEVLLILRALHGDSSYFSALSSLPISSGNKGE